MAETRYRVIFRAEILEGFSEGAVRAELVRLFSLDPKASEKLFDSPAVVIRSGLDKATALIYEKAMSQAGAKVYLEAHSATDAADATGTGGRQEGFAPAAAQDGTPESYEPTAPETGIAQEVEEGDAAEAVSMAPSETNPAPEMVPAEASPLSAGSFVKHAAHASATDATPPVIRPENLGFEFRGTGGEYFRIWIVNFFLTVITVGIYSPWAKVRTRQYFYGNTILDGAGFEYRANPVAILKGRIIALIFFTVSSLVSNLSPIAGLVTALLFFFVVPWLAVRSLSFNATNSAFRNVRFGFDGTMAEAAKAFVLWPLLAMVTLGALFPYAFYRQQLFIVGNSRYGRSSFKFDASPRDYYSVFFACFLIIAACVAMGFGLSFIGGMLGLSALTGPAGGLLGFAAYFIVFAAVTVRMTNLRFNSARLAAHGFSATLDTASYAWLVFTNTLGTVLTLGFFHPWAKVRTARYRTDRLALAAAGPLGTFVAAEERRVSALGEEVGEMFDFEIGL